MAIIKNYGLRWVREKVDWGGPGNRGSLGGKRATARSSDSVDFREQIGIYVLYEPGFVPVYIGQAGFGAADLFTRLRNHRNDHLRDRWTHFSWFGFRDVNANCTLSARQNPDARTSLSYIEALDEVEGVLIQVLEPRLNKQGAKWQQTADEYVQDALPPEADRIAAIESTLNAILLKLPKP
ncbi:GIY-YIG nuclease family protein [Siccirubricoccus sp. G192]|uniref:GIY-YIG nuclease family protein n=1 Tax=Siccirubricoccus sp. G192 TaxID=2849651 RepID=UPI001C2BDA91|nr:GIY-YIG nuclease family protein [Siccirubricoccus sp. G192]MBV1798438.1 GIY-YIG nuclease family protein [Siccirubricoccus sp. G192]